MGARRARGDSGRRQWLVGLTEYAGLTEYTGGIGTHYAALLPALVRQGIDVDLVLFGEAGAESVQLVDGVRVLRARPRGAGPAGMLGRARAFRRAYGSGAYDAVWMPEWGALGALLPGRAPLVTNLATGIRLGDWIAGRRTRDFPLRLRPGRWAQNVAENRQIRRSRGLVSISDAVLRWNQHFIAGLPPAAIVRNCVDVAAIRRQADAGQLPAGWPGADGLGSPIILFAGRLERRKGVLVAMEAFRAVLEQHPTARLVLAGAPGDRRFEPTRDELLDALPREFRRQTTFLGHINGEQLFAAMSRADVVMCPSLWEGFGNVALEVKAAGVPLVVTTGSGFDDFCRDDDDCLMVAPGDADALATAVVRVLESAELRARLVRSATRSVERFAPDPAAADLIVAVEALLQVSPCAASGPRRT